MRTSFRIAAVGAALAAASLATSAQAATSASATASATILSALNIVNTQALNFDTIAVNGAGTATISTNGTLTCTAVQLICPGNNATQAAFTVSGGANSTAAVTLPSSAVTLTAAGGATMTVDTFTANTTTLSLGSGGSAPLYVGGTLHVAAGQAAGAYTGTFNVSVQYQ